MEKEILKALLVHYPGQSVEWEEPWCQLFNGHWEDEYLYDVCIVESIYIKDNELCFDLIKESSTDNGTYGTEELKGVTWDFILGKTYEMDFDESELGYFIQDICEDIHEVVIPSSVTRISAEFFKDCTSLQKIVISEGVKTIEKRVFQGCSSLEVVHLPAGVSTIEFDSFKDCDKLKAIYVPKQEVDNYKKCFPSDQQWLIVEEGSDFPVKGEKVIAKDISFAPTLRLIVSKGETDSGILSALEMHLEQWSKSQIIKWVIGNLDTIADSKEPFSEKD